MKRDCAFALIVLSALGLQASTALADTSFVIDDYSTDEFFTGLLALPGSASSDIRDTLRNGNAVGLTNTRRSAMGLSGGPLNDVSGIASGSVSGGSMTFGASIAYTGPNPTRNILATAAASYAASSFIDLSQAISADLVVSGSITGDLRTAGVLMFDQFSRFRYYTLFLPSGAFSDLSFNLATPSYSDGGFDMTHVSSIRWEIATTLSGFYGDAVSADLTLAVDTFGLTFVPAPGAAAIAGLSILTLSRRRR